MKSPIQGNPLYNEILYTRRTRRKYENEDHLQTEINYTYNETLYI